MKRFQNKRRRTMLITLLISGVLFAAGGFFYGFFYGNSYAYERMETVTIRSFADLEALEKDEVLNDRYILAADITVSGDLTVGTAEHPFSGVFEGRGHTVTYSDATSPLFGYTAKDSRISGLTVKGHMLFDELFSAGIAAVNYGAITDCKAELSMELSEGVRYAGAVSAVNCGEVSHCIVDADFSGGNDMHVIAGGVAGHNRGRITAAAVTARFKDFDEVHVENNFEGGVSNHGVGAVTGVNKGEIMRCGAEQLGYYLTDYRAAGIDFLSADELYDPDYIFLKVGFSHSVWEYGDGKYKIIPTEITHED